MTELIAKERERLSKDDDLTPPAKDASVEQWKAYHRAVREIERESTLDPTLPVEEAKRVYMQSRKEKAQERQKLISEIHEREARERQAARENHPRFAERKAAEAAVGRVRDPKPAPGTRPAPPPSPVLDLGPGAEGIDEAELVPPTKKN